MFFMYRVSIPVSRGAKLIKIDEEEPQFRKKIKWHIFVVDAVTV